MALNRWTIGWIVILAALFGWEIAAAIVGGPGPQTLSEHVWLWFSWRGGWLVLTIGLGYLTWHLARGAWKKGQR